MAVSGFRFRARLDFTIPFSFSGQRGITPAFGYGAPHPSTRGTSTLLSNALLSAHYAGIRLLADVDIGRARPCAFPDLPTADGSAGSDEISQFVFEELLRIRRALYRVESSGGSREAPSVWPSASLNSVGTQMT